MENYFTFTHLIGVREANLPPYRDLRLQRYKSVQRLMDLIQIAHSTRPTPGFAFQTINLDPHDPEWDDVMPFPTIDYPRYAKLALLIGAGLTFYSYNYNMLHHNIRFKAFKLFYPVCLASAFVFGYIKYRQQILKINLFDEYCYMRANELVDQNQYLLSSPDFQQTAWWRFDFEDTMKKIHRQANDNKESDFKDSELLLQDFINRYVDPNAQSPMKPFASRIQ